jgi:hypothetical protein
VNRDISTVVTENYESKNNSTVCPRIIERPKCTTKQKGESQNLQYFRKPHSPKTQVSFLLYARIRQILDDMPLTKENYDNVNPIELGVKIEDSSLSETQFMTVNKLPNKSSHVFSNSFMNIGRTELVKHQIELEDDTPFNCHIRVFFLA